MARLANTPVAWRTADLPPLNRTRSPALSMSDISCDIALALAANDANRRKQPRRHEDVKRLHLETGVPDRSNARVFSFVNSETHVSAV